MSNKNYELELFKLVEGKGNDYVYERGWVSDTEFYIWVYYFNLEDFINEATEIFGNGMFEDGGFFGHMRADSVCIDLCEMLEEYDIDFEAVFPKDEYPH